MEMNSIPWSPILRDATPLPMNRTPISTVALQHKSVSSVLRYATPLPMNMTPCLDRSAPRQVCFLRFAVRHTPPDQQDPRFDRRRSVSSVLRYTTPLSINRTPVPNEGGLFPPLCGTPGLVSIASSVQVLLMNTTTHSVPTQPRCLPMNTMHSVASP